jgi:hypothetical protein
VDRRSLTLDDVLSITLTLTGAQTGIDDVDIPVQNLTLDGEPSERSEITFVNGAGSYRKIYRWTAKPKAPGPALVGPVVLKGKNGADETLAPIALQVLPDVTGGSNDPLTILRELVATHRDPVFLVVDVDKTSAFTGQQIIVTWMLYNGTSLRRYGIEDIPQLDDFWVEEIPLRGVTAEVVELDGIRLQRAPVRRAALYPLRPGTLAIGPLAINAEAIKRVGADRFGLPYEGMLVEILRRSPRVAIEARPLPPGPPVSAVGDVTLSCSPLPKSVAGPVAVHAVMQGAANLRAAAAPAFERPVDGTVQVVDAGFTVERRAAGAPMSRRWRYVIFPTRPGPLTIPPLTATILTAAGERRTLRCEESTLLSTAAEQPAVHQGAEPVRVVVERRFEQVAPWLALALGLLTAGALGYARARRAWRLRAATRALLRATPADTRDAVDAWLAQRGFVVSGLLQEPSDRGDAVRALHSLVDDRIEAAPREVRRRVAEVVALIVDR